MTQKPTNHKHLSQDEIQNDLVQNPVQKKKNPKMGRRLIEEFQKLLRIPYARNPFRVKAVYWHSFTMFLLQKLKLKSLSRRFKKKYTAEDKRLQQKISSFIEDKKAFLSFLSFMIRDRFPSIDTLLKMDDQSFTKQYVTQPIPGAFLAGLKYYQEYQQSNKQNTSSSCSNMTIQQIKILFLISLLIIGISHNQLRQCHIDYIDYFLLNDQEADHHFNTILPILLEKTKLVDNAIFDLFYQYWDSIVELTKNGQIQIGQPIQEVQQQEFADYNINHQQNDVNQEKIQQVTEKHISLKDVQLQKMEEQKTIIQKQPLIECQHMPIYTTSYEFHYQDGFLGILNNINQLELFYQDQMQKSQQMILEELQQNQQKKETENFQSESTKNNSRNENSQKSQQTLKQKKKINKKSNKGTSNIIPKKQSTKFKLNKKQEKKQHARKSKDFERFININHETSLGEICSSSNSMNTNQAICLFDQTLTQLESKQNLEECGKNTIAKRIPNPNRKVPHVKKESQILGNLLLQDEYVLAYGIANYIDAATKAQNIHIIYGKRPAPKLTTILSDTKFN